MVLVQSHMVCKAQSAHTSFARGKPKRPRGFTLIELVVVIGIIGLVISLALPVIMSARSSAKRTAINYQLQMIGTALEAYNKDFFGSYPAIDTSAVTAPAVGDNGAFALCRLLLAPAPETAPAGPGNLFDYVDGPGFKVRAGGKKYGPYLLADNFRLAYATTVDGSPGLSAEGVVLQPRDYSRLVITDRSGKPILYAPTISAKPKLSQTWFAIRKSLPPGSPPANANIVYFDIDQLLGHKDSLTPELTEWRAYLRQIGETDETKIVERVQRMLGDANANGKLDSGETNAFAAQYMLWSAGLDGVYGDVAGKKSDDLVLTDIGQ